MSERTRLAARGLGLQIPANLGEPRAAGRWLVRGLDWTAPAGGGVLGIIGPNGAGKTTLLRSFVGLIRAREGEVKLDTRPIESLPARSRARKLAYLPQGQSTPYDLPVEDVVMLGRAPHRAWFAPPSAEDRRAVHEALVACEVETFAERGIRSLSGGERQRVMLARMLATRADLLILDEPTTGLDIGHALRICALLRSLADAGHTVVVALHELELARRICDEVLLLRGDQAGSHACGPATEILTPSHLDAVFDVRTRIVDGALLVEGPSPSPAPQAETFDPDAS